MNSENIEISSNPYKNFRYTLPTEISNYNQNIVAQDHSQFKDMDSSILSDEYFPLVSPFDVNTGETLKSSVMQYEDPLKTKNILQNIQSKIGKSNRVYNKNYSRDIGVLCNKMEKSKKPNLNEKYLIESNTCKENLKKNCNIIPKSMLSEKDRLLRENKTKKKLRAESILRESNCSVKTLEDKQSPMIDSTHRTFYKKTQAKVKQHSKSKTKIKLKSPVRYSLNLAQNLSRRAQNPIVTKEPNSKTTKNPKLFQKRNSDLFGKNKLHESLVSHYLGNVIGSRKNTSHESKLRNKIRNSFNANLNSQNNETLNMNSISTWRRNIMHAYDLHQIR